MKIFVHKLVNLQSPGIKNYRVKIAKIFAICFLIVICALIAPNTFAQTAEDTTDGRFHDELLNHLVGTWNVTATANGDKFTATIKAEWVMSHQYLHIYEKADENIPWLHTPLEIEFFIGYNHNSKRYVVHEMAVFGSDGPYEGFCYAYRNGNEIKLVKKCEGDSAAVTIQRFTWEPSSATWHSEIRQVTNENEGDVLVDQKLVAVKKLSK